MDKPIPEAVAILEALQERWCVSTSGKDGSRRIATFDPARGARGEDDFDNEVFATRKCASDLALAIERIRALAAAQQQGQAVAWVSAADIAPFIGAPQMAAFWGTVTLASGPGDGRTVPLYLTTPPSAPVGVEDAGSRAVAAELLRCFESWEPGVRVLGNVQARDGADLMRRILAQQPAAVDGADAKLALANDISRAFGNTNKAITDYLWSLGYRKVATQHQEPTT